MRKKDIIIGLFVALIIAFAFSPFASSFPDGLEKVAEQKGFIERGAGPAILKSPIPDYRWPKIVDPKFATSLSGLTGTFVVFGLVYGLAFLLKKKENNIEK